MHSGPLFLRFPESGVAHRWLRRAIIALAVAMLAVPASGSHTASAAQIILTPNCGPPGPGLPVTLDLTPPEDTNEVGDFHTLTAMVLDAESNPVPDGTSVSFSASRPGGQSSVSGSANTVGGQASFGFTSIRPGTSDIIATAGTAADVATKTWIPGPPASVVLLPSTDTNDEGDIHTVTATVRDGFGNFVVDGTQVDFEASGTGSESPTSGTDTTVNGEATFAFTSNISGSGGTSTITATAGSASDTASKTWNDIFPPVELTRDAVRKGLTGLRTQSASYFTRVARAPPMELRSILASPAPPGRYEFTVTGQGFFPGRVEIVFDLGGVREPFSATADAGGKFGITITPVQRPPGTYVVEASDSNRSHVDTALFFAPCPTFEVVPILGRSGLTTVAIGTGFLPNAEVALDWGPGVGGATVMANDIGFFQTRVLVLPGDREGPRKLRASIPASPEFPQPEDDYLVVPGTVQPQDFVVRR